MLPQTSEEMSSASDGSDAAQEHGGTASTEEARQAETGLPKGAFM